MSGPVLPPLHPRRSLARLLTCATLAWQGLVAAQGLSPEERLNAVRQSLLQAALETPTQVVATSWIDGQGVLREMNSFRNGMQVRGVRIVSYERDAQGQPSAALQWDKVAPTGDATEKTAEKSAASCAPASERFKHLVTLNWIAPAGLSVDERAMVEALRTLVVERLRANAASTGHWKVRDRLPEPQGAYARALLGEANPATAWNATLKIAPVPAQSAAAPKPAPAPETVANKLNVAPASGPVQPFWDHTPRMSVRVELVLQEREAARPGFQRALQLDLVSDQAGFGPVQLSEATRLAVAPQISYMAEALGTALACRAFNPQVTLVSGTEFQMDAGAASGVQVGDEWILVNSQQIPQRALDAGVIAQTVLARVSSVSEGSAQLQWLAGPQKSVQPQWRAWPARSLP
jgi:hypothetical protein